MFTSKEASLKLPKEPRLELIALALGLNTLQETNQIDTIFQHHTYDGLKLYLPRGLAICCQLESDGIDEEDNNDGSVTLFSRGATHHFHTSTDLVQVGKCSLDKAYNLVVTSLLIGGNEYLPLDETGQVFEFIQVKPAKVFALREEFVAFVERDTVDIPSYADPNSEHYAPELALAIKLHQIIRVEEESYRGNMRDAVELWLRKNRPDLDLTEALKGRISTMINQNTLTQKPPNKSKG